MRTNAGTTVHTTRAQLLLSTSILIAMIAYGMTLPLFPFLLDSFGGRGLHMGLLVAAYGVMQLLCAPIWGRMSDRTGRKPVLLLGMAGLAASLLVFALARNLSMLYLGQLLMGGLTSALFPVASAYVTDVSSSEARAGALGKIGAATGLGIVVGPGIGGLLAFDSLSLPFFISAAAALLVCAFMVIFLPESLHHRTTTHAGDSPFGLAAAARALRGPIGIGLLLLFAVYFGKSNLSGVFSLFAMEKFGYGTTEIGGLLMIMGLGYALV
ncbi:MAG: MFS transporter, partial [Spirochaetaceae bacterium]